ncbi:6-bladed beta-propeller [Penaeicola halotolerans]|uniref:6-bladed beta-propeller n=1 Tax=Penaeicola halotolerans TaxID=2793196 RepID=UPI001CF823A9|nr:6-bladed beta-propeller [Penaeicola halotolerans]
MRESFKYFLISTYVSSLLSCGQSKESVAVDPSKRASLRDSSELVYIKDQMITFNLSSTPIDALPFEDYFEVEKVIYLDDQVLIGEVRNLVYFDEKYFFHDRISEKVHCFGAGGEHLWSTENKGEGPNEYRRVSAFDIDEQDSVMCLWDGAGLQVLRYSLESGKVIERDEVQTFGHGFLVSGGAYIFYPLNFYHEDLAYKILRINRQNEIEKRALPFESIDFVNSHLPKRIFTKEKSESFYFVQQFNDTVYHYSHDTLYAKYSMVYDKVERPNYDDFTSSDELKKSLKNRGIYDKSMDDIQVLGDNILFSYNRFDENLKSFLVHNGLLNTRANEVQLFKKFDNYPFEYKGYNWLEIQYAINGSAYSIVDPAAYKEIKDNWSTKIDGEYVSELVKREYPEIYEIMTSLDEDSNPLIIKLKIK